MLKTQEEKRKFETVEWAEEKEDGQAGGPSRTKVFQPVFRSGLETPWFHVCRVKCKLNKPHGLHRFQADWTIRALGQRPAKLHASCCSKSWTWLAPNEHQIQTRSPLSISTPLHLNISEIYNSVLRSNMILTVFCTISQVSLDSRMWNDLG